MTKEILEKWLIRRLAREIGINPKSIDSKAPLFNYLMNGFQSFGVVKDLEQALKRRLSASILYDHPTIQTLAEHLIEQSQKKSFLFNKGRNVLPYPLV